MAYVENVMAEAMVCLQDKNAECNKVGKIQKRSIDRMVAEVIRTFGVGTTMKET